MDLPPPSLEPNASREPETLGKDDQDWVSALRESVSFGRFLSESLEWDTMRHVLPAPTATILHDQSLPAAGLNQDVQVNFSVPTTMVRAQSASSNCGAACIGDSGAGVSCSPCLPAARSSTNIEGAALHLDAAAAASRHHSLGHHRHAPPLHDHWSTATPSSPATVPPKQSIGLPASVPSVRTSLLSISSAR